MDPTEDLRYRQSTQFRLWSYARPSLAALRQKTNGLAATHIATRLQPAPEFLTPEEERRLLDFFTVELLRAAAYLELPTEIRASAAVHMRRFYVTNSVMTYSPTDLLKTCLFFGSKGEGFYERLSRWVCVLIFLGALLWGMAGWSCGWWGLREGGKGKKEGIDADGRHRFAEKLPNTTAEEVLAGEFLLCQGIRFCFDVRHPFRALEGVILELRRHFPEEVCPPNHHLPFRHISGKQWLKTKTPFQNTRIEKAHARARHILKFSPLVTDAYFHYTPSQIMFAALSMADQELAGRMLERTFGFETSTGGEGGDATMDGAHDEVRGKILRTIESCREMLEAEPPERMDEFWGTVSFYSPL